MTSYSCFQTHVLDVLDKLVDTRRNQEGHLGHLPPPKFLKHCIAILTFAETFKE